jgi:hypothetical protein
MRARVALMALPLLLAIVLAVQLNMLADRLAAAATGVALCTTGALHTSEEPPDLPLTRDYALLRVLLKDPAGQFDHMRQLYDGALRAPKIEPAAAFLGKRSERLTLAHDLHAPRSLRVEAERIDRDRGTRIAEIIERGLVVGDRAAVEAGFRQMFAALLDETLAGIQERLDKSGAARSFQYVRRFYSTGIEAYLALTSPAGSLSASAALDSMRRALETSTTSPDSSNRFDRERRRFMQAVKEAVEL